MAGRKRIALTVGLLLLAVTGMSSLVAASVPLYQMFCRVTGYGGTTRVSAGPTKEIAREVTVRFDSSVARGLPWRFQPEQRSVRVHLGEEAIAFFKATNTSDRPITGTATFNVSPAKVGRYFNKVQCFCFTEQHLAPGETAEMPVTFFVDPALASDEYANEVDTITLSYTFFEKGAGS